MSSPKLSVIRVRTRPGLIEQPVRGFHLLDHPLDGLAVRDVALDREPADLLGRLPDLVGRAGGDGDLCAGGGEFERDATPYPPPASRDKRDLVLKLAVLGHTTI